MTIRVPALRPARRLGLTRPQQLGLLVLVLATVFPIYWMLVSSLKSDVELLGSPSLLPDLSRLHPEHYAELWRIVPFGNYFFNSMVVCLTSTLVATAFAALAGFSLANFSIRGSGAFSVAVLATQLLPGILFGIRKRMPSSCRASSS